MKVESVPADESTVRTMHASTSTAVVVGTILTVVSSLVAITSTTHEDGLKNTMYAMGNKSRYVNL